MKNILKPPASWHLFSPRFHPTKRLKRSNMKKTPILSVMFLFHWKFMSRLYPKKKNVDFLRNLRFCSEKKKRLRVGPILGKNSILDPPSSSSVVFSIVWGECHGVFTKSVRIPPISYKKNTNKHLAPKLVTFATEKNRFRNSERWLGRHKKPYSTLSLSHVSNDQQRHPDMNQGKSWLVQVQGFRMTHGLSIQEIPLCHRVVLVLHSLYTSNNRGSPL